MALTKVTGQVVLPTTDLTVGVLTVTNTVSVGGTLTYEDVTNVDSVGLITARAGVNVGSGITLSSDGDGYYTGIVTARAGVNVGSGITLSSDGDGYYTGIVTATKYYGDGSALSNITSTAINNNANNRIITGSGTANTLEGESTLTYDGTNLDLGDDKKIRVGASQDLQIFHDAGAGSNIRCTGTKLEIRSDSLQLQASNAEKYLLGTADGSVELYHDGTKKFETKSGGADVHGTLGVKGIEGGAATINLWADEGDDAADKWRMVASESANTFSIQAIPDGGTWENSIICRGDAATEFYYNNTKKFETDASAMTIHGGITYEASGTDWKIQCGQGVSSNIFINAVKDESSIFIERNQGVSLYHNGTSKAYTASNGLFLHDRLVPHTDDSYDLGGGSNRWDDVYATNTTIQTSDRNAKDNITASDLGLAFVNKLTPVSYKWKGKTRTHYGLVAQDVGTVLTDIGKSTTQFAGYIKSENPKEYYTSLAETEGTSKNVGDVKKEASTTYGLRYNEFIGPLVKAVQELSAEVETLKAEVTALKSS